MGPREPIEDRARVQGYAFKAYTPWAAHWFDDYESAFQYATGKKTNEVDENEYRQLVSVISW